MEPTLRKICGIFTLGIFFAFAGCSHSGDSPQTATKQFLLIGKVVALDKTTNRLTVDHREIPGFMGAMTMAYQVKDAKELNDLVPGDEIHCDLILNGSDMWLQKIVVTKKHSETPQPKS